MKLVIISALWCPSCLILKKEIKKLEEEYPNINLLKLDYDFDDISKYNVGKKLPEIIIENDNDIKDRLIGEKTYDEIINFLKENNVI